MEARKKMLTGAKAAEILQFPLQRPAKDEISAQRCIAQIITFRHKSEPRETEIPSREYVDWPENEKTPSSLREAQASGWEIEGNDWEASEDETIHVGTMNLLKKIGNMALRLKIPYRAELVHGRPCDPEAIRKIVNEDSAIASVFSPTSAC
jgi:hypothetical protein